MKRGKKYQDAVKAYDRSAQYDVAEALLSYAFTAS